MEQFLLELFDAMLSDLEDFIWSVAVWDVQRVALHPVRSIVCAATAMCSFLDHSFNGHNHV